MDSGVAGVRIHVVRIDWHINKGAWFATRLPTFKGNSMARFLLFCMLLLQGQAVMALTYTLEMTESEIQQKVSAMMPVEKKKVFGTVTLSDPVVTLVNGSNEIAVAFKIKVRLVGGYTVSGKAKIKGAIRYEAAAGEFFLRNSKLEEFTIDKLPETYHRDVKGVVEMMMQEVLLEYPIYKLKNDNLKHKLVKAVLQSVTVTNQKLVAVLKY